MKHSKSPVVRMAELEIDPGQLESYKSLLAEEIETSVRVEPGVLSLHAVSLKDQPTHIRIFEVYASQNAYEAHLNTPHFLNYKAQAADMIRSLQVVETNPILLRSKLNGGGAEVPISGSGTGGI